MRCIVRLHIFSQEVSEALFGAVRRGEAQRVDELLDAHPTVLERPDPVRADCSYGCRTGIATYQSARLARRPSLWLPYHCLVNVADTTADGHKTISKTLLSAQCGRVGWIFNSFCPLQLYF